MLDVTFLLSAFVTLPVTIAPCVQLDELESNPPSSRLARGNHRALAKRVEGPCFLDWP